MIHQYSKIFLSLLTLPTFLDAVSGGYIRTHKSDSSRHVEGQVIVVPDLGKLGKYVCPRDTSLVSRQVSSGEIIVSTSDLTAILVELRLAEVKLRALLQNPNGIPPPPRPVQSVIASAPPTQTVIAVSSAPYSATNDLTTTLTETSTITSTTTEWVVTVTETVIETIYPYPATGSVDYVAGPSTTLVAVPDTTLLPPAISSAPLQIGFTTAYIAAPATSTDVAAPPPAQPINNPPSTLNQVSTDQAGKYQFNPRSNSNVAVYYGQSPATSTTSLASQCADPSIDIVILAFVISQLSGGSKYPSINFGATCGGQTAIMASQAPGLLYCPDLAAQIKTCQSTYGKKVFLSVGGAASSISFTGVDQAKAFGDVLWDVFGPAGNVDAGLRPFGSVEVDGFDIDNEDGQPAHFDTLALTFRAHFSHVQHDKTYYLSSAPQCPFPDASDPMPMLLMCDFVFVQFYNNPSCEIGSSRFQASIKQWSQALDASTLSTKTKLYLGAPGWSAAGPSAYSNGIGNPQGMRKLVKGVEGMNLDNFGGVMFWDGPEGVANVGGGKDIIAWAKEGLAS
ncbi:uncharacterized protein PAC_02918 [Phialocephala subalpina]|uniref:GH18 domain-containing protein n=1 Tax=Phialocephala subalpina TaxID=576137 RepID=A0A1L7WJU9_9HELO|nr:uncharacterized protein PAC_02918 [Phialocephala subalpina]